MIPKDSFLYRSGDIWLPKPIVKALDTYIVGDSTTLFYLNYWHINHFLSGVFFALFHVFVYRIPSPLLSYLLLHTLWELWQMLIGMTPRNQKGMLDALVDTLIGLLGVWSVFLLERKQ